MQFEFPDENGNPYKSTGGKMSRTKDFGLAPCGWKFGNLYDIAEFINGLACQKYRPMEDEAFVLYPSPMSGVPVSAICTASRSDAIRLAKNEPVGL